MPNRVLAWGAQPPGHARPTPGRPDHDRSDNHVRNQILAAAIGAAVCLLVASLVINDGPGVGPQAIIVGIAGGIIGWLAVRAA